MNLEQRPFTTVGEISLMASAALYDLKKEVDKIKHEQQRTDNDYRNSIQYHDAVLVFRQSLSFARLILNDRDFFNDELNEETCH